MKLLTLISCLITLYFGFAFSAPLAAGELGENIVDDLPYLQAICRDVSAINRILREYPENPQLYLICQYGKLTIGKCSGDDQFVVEEQDCERVNTNV